GYRQYRKVRTTGPQQQPIPGTAEGFAGAQTLCDFYPPVPVKRGARQGHAVFLRDARAGIQRPAVDILANAEHVGQRRPTRPVCRNYEAHGGFQDPAVQRGDAGRERVFANQRFDPRQRSAQALV
ncbi:hypothetical protein IWW55_002230, partial [Coemansia sp. RSA 2706]